MSSSVLDGGADAVSAIDDWGSSVSDVAAMVVGNTEKPLVVIERSSEVETDGTGSAVVMDGTGSTEAIDDTSSVVGIDAADSEVTIDDAGSVVVTGGTGSVSVTGQIVVDMAIVSVMRTVEPFGQSGTSGAQLVTV